MSVCLSNNYWFRHKQLGFKTNDGINYSVIVQSLTRQYNDMGDYD